MNLPRNRIQRQALIGFSAAAVLLVLFCATAVFAIRRRVESAYWVTHTYQVISELEALSSSLDRMEAAHYGFLASGAEVYLGERQAAASRLRQHVQTLTQLVADNVQQVRRVQTLRERLTQSYGDRDPLVDLAQQQGLDPARQLAAARASTAGKREVDTRLAELVQTEYDLLTARNRADTHYESMLVAAFSGLLVSIAGVLGWLFARLRSDMTRRLEQEAEQQRAHAALQAANRELESFSYSVSHDLRTPLRAIDGYAQMLDEDYSAQLAEEGRRYIRIVREGTSAWRR